MNNSPIVTCDRLCKNYGGKTALSNLNMEIGRGKVVGLLGPNGSGKTTFIKLLNGLIQPSSGELRVDGKLPGVETKAIVSYLPDRSYFADWMTVRDIFDIFEDFYDNFNRQKAVDMCALLGVSEKDRIKSMSKGTKEKVQIAIVMCREADLYLLDEPIAGVDPVAREYILNTIINNYKDDGTIILSTHLITDIERILDEVVFIKEGEIIRHAAVDDLKEREGVSIDELFRKDFRWGGVNNVR